MIVISNILQSKMLKYILYWVIGGASETLMTERSQGTWFQYHHLHQVIVQHRATYHCSMLLDLPTWSRFDQPYMVPGGCSMPNL